MPARLAYTRRVAPAASTLAARASRGMRRAGCGIGGGGGKFRYISALLGELGGPALGGMLFRHRGQVAPRVCRSWEGRRMRKKTHSIRGAQRIWISAPVIRTCSGILEEHGMAGVDESPSSEIQPPC